MLNEGHDEKDNDKIHTLNDALQGMNMNAYTPQPPAQKRARKKRGANLVSARSTAAKVNSKALASAKVASQLKESLNNSAGRTRTESENKLILQYMLHQFINGAESANQAVEACVEVFGGGKAIYYELWNNFWRCDDDNKRSVKPVKKKRGRPPKQTFDILEIDSNCNGKLLELLGEYAFKKTIKSPRGFTQPDFEAYLRENKVNIESHLVRKFLLQNNFGYMGKDVSYGENPNNKDRIASKKSTCYKLSHAIQLEEGKVPEQKHQYKLACFDQSWVNKYSNPEWSWIHDCDRDPECEKSGICSIFNKLGDEKTRLKTKIRKRGKGERIAFQHVCLRKGGLLYDEGCHRLPRKGAGSNYNEEMKTSEFLMLCGKSTGDHHKNVTGELMVKLFENRIIPSFKAVYPNHKLILFCDRAPYHCARSGFPSYYNSRKGDFAQCLKDYGVESIKVIRFIKEAEEIVEKEFEFEQDVWDKIAPGGPYTEELFMYLWKWCEKNKREALIPDISKIMAKHGYYLIYNTPNNPDYMPAEMFNNYTKWYVKKKVSSDRTIDELWKHTLEGMYGSDEREGVTPQRMGFFWSHCEELIKKDLVQFELEPDLNKLWTPGCGYSALEQEIITPISPTLLKKFNDKFRVVIE